ncbi:MAG: PepSY domain-containing protein [Henriciella sp.]
MASVKRSTLQQRVWRWHFLAGLVVVPFVIILAVTGSIYLFKPQYDAAIEASINQRASEASCGTSVIAGGLVLREALAAYPDTRLVRMVLPTSADDPTMEAEIMTGAGEARTLWLDKTTADILHDTPTGAGFMNVVKAVHGTLLGGSRGSLIVEIMACWTLILMVTGLYLWWPRGMPWWRALVPDFSGNGGKRETWKKVHGATGSWIGVLAVIMLLSGLPWTQVWGEGFTRAKALAGLKSPGQEWFVTLQSSDPHVMHEMGGSLWETDTTTPAQAASASSSLMHSTPLSLQSVVSQANAEGLDPPVWVQPPRGENGVWTVRGMHPNRMRQETVHYDRWTGEEVMRIRFEDHNVADRTMALGVSFHEGALFGWVNQLLALAAALGIALVSVTGAVMWWKRRPAGKLAVPAMPADRRIAGGVFGVILALCLFLPMAGVTLLAALILDMVFQKIGRRRSQA